MLTGEKPWVKLLPGKQAHELEFTKEGSLTYQGKVLLPKVPVSYVSDGTVIQAAIIIVSNPSPSGKFNLFQGCELPDEQKGLCWALYLVDKQQGKVTKTHAGKYGSYEWVRWSKDERYAILASSNEGASWLHAIDLRTGDSRSWELGNRIVDLKSFSWTGDRTFQVKIFNKPASITPEKPENDNTPSSLFKGNIEDIY